ncbi:MAG: hypothetical protein RLZZ04_2860 [Cyanobacteriota bacterium]
MEILTSIAPISLLAEIPDFAVGDALDILQNYSFISNKLAESFQTVWDGVIFTTTASYWRAIIAGGLDFALLGMILYAWEGFKVKSDKRQQYTIDGIVMVLILSILLGGNGSLTSNILRITHSFDQNLTRTLANTQILDLTIADSLKNISLSNDAHDEVDKLLAECNDLSGNEALQCMEKQIPEIEKIVTAAEQNDPLANNPAAKYAKGVLKYLQDLGTNVVNGDGLKVAAQISNTLAIQLAFNFALEVAGLLHALLLPLVIAVIFTPIGPKYVETWIQGYVQLVLIKFLYIAVIGLAGSAIVMSEAQLATGPGFLVFSSVMGPALAFYMAKGGGADLAKFVSSQVTSAMSNTVQGGAAIATGGVSKAGSLAGKSLFNLGKKGLARRTTRRST